MNKKSIRNKVAQTLAALIVTACLSGCQTGKTPHPFTTMFDRRAPEYGVTQTVYQENIPDTMSEQPIRTAEVASPETY